MLQTYSEFTCGDTTIRYLLDEESNRIGLQIFPLTKKNRIVEKRKDLSDVVEIQNMDVLLPVPPQASVVQPVVEFSIIGDPRGFALGQGQTLRRGQASQGQKIIGQNISDEREGFIIETTCENNALSIVTRHFLQWRKNSPFLTIWSEFNNTGKQPISLEYLTSFNLGHITPFHPADAPEQLFVHRLRSAWSAEGRHTVQRLEELELERSWLGHAMRCERFGMTGTKPTGRWFPFVAVEDRAAGVFWGAQLGWAGSWQMELFRQDDFLTLSGGLADRELGHWVKQIQPGENFASPSAVITTTDADFEDLCSRLTAAQVKAADEQPEPEHFLPVLFNEWCTSWGNPNHSELVFLADICKTYGFRYFVIDSGWYADHRKWEEYQGDWKPAPTLFPEGLPKTCEEIRTRGLVPGLWFEFEVIGQKSSLWERKDLLLLRDGLPIQAGFRRFLDFRQEEVHSYLEKRVLDLIEQCGIGYVKVDYNETPGFGVDDDESLGEGLRQHVEGVYRFFQRMRTRFPELIIENCSSGGQRLEPSLIGLTAMSSFSDAHETVAIPIIAANMHRIILPRQAQIWAVLRHTDTEKRLYYSLTATFLGRMCISGDLSTLNPQQEAILHAAIVFYRKGSAIIKNGISYRLGPEIISYLYPRGQQAVLRFSEDRKELLFVGHRFEEKEESWIIPIPTAKTYKIERTFTDSNTSIDVEEGNIKVQGLSAFGGCAALLGESHDA
jgi:alpha-galactosidase